MGLVKSPNFYKLVNYQSKLDFGTKAEFFRGNYIFVTCQRKISFLKIPQINIKKVLTNSQLYIIIIKLSRRDVRAV